MIDAINVIYQGAAGDGLADDTAAIQAAIDIASVDRFRPLPVYFPPGNYRTTAQLLCTTNNVALIGAGGGIEYQAGEYAGGWKGITRLFYDGPDDNTTYMLRFGNGEQATRGHVMRDLILDCVGKVNGVRMDRCSSSLFDRVSMARPYSGWVTLDASYCLTWQDCDVYDAKSVFMDLRQEAHRANIIRGTFNSLPTDAGGTSLPKAVIRIGKGGTHSSNVNITGANFDVYRVPYFVECLDAYAFNMDGVYMEGRDDTLVNCVRLGDTADPTKEVRGANFKACRMTLPEAAPLAGAVGLRRAHGVKIDGGTVWGFDKVADINHATCSGVAVHCVGKGVGTINANAGAALVSSIG